MQKLKTKAKFYKYMARFLELSIWVLFFGLIIFVIVSYNSYSHKNYSRYQIFLQDVDGIIVGSPVRMMGITVGYVKHIKPVNDMVFVDFIINQKGIEIPKGSKVTVEFSGLGGSKSLEIYTPEKKYENYMPALTIQQPVRLGASARLLYQMFKKIGDIIYRCTYFSQSLQFDKIENTGSVKKSSEQLVNEINKLLEQQEKDKKESEK